MWGMGKDLVWEGLLHLRMHLFGVKTIGISVHSNDCFLVLFYRILSLIKSSVMYSPI